MAFQPAGTFNPVIPGSAAQLNKLRANDRMRAAVAALLNTGAHHGHLRFMSEDIVIATFTANNNPPATNEFAFREGKAVEGAPLFGRVPAIQLWVEDAQDASKWCLNTRNTNALFLADSNIWVPNAPSIEQGYTYGYLTDPALPGGVNNWSGIDCRAIYIGGTSGEGAHSGRFTTVDEFLFAQEPMSNRMNALRVNGRMCAAGGDLIEGIIAGHILMEIVTLENVNSGDWMPVALTRPFTELPQVWVMNGNGAFWQCDAGNGRFLQLCRDWDETGGDVRLEALSGAIVTDIVQVLCIGV